MLDKDNKLRILRLFFESPEKKFHIREIARMTKLSPPGVMKIVKYLEKENLVVSQDDNVVRNISTPRSEKFLQLKRFFNLYSLYDSGLVDFLREQYEEPEAIVLFGSYSRGEDISRSDIDIAVITNKRISARLKKFEVVLKRKISVHEIELKEAGKEFINTLSNGIVLSGYLKAIR